MLAELVLMVALASDESRAKALEYLNSLPSLDKYFGDAIARHRKRRETAPRYDNANVHVMMPPPPTQKYTRWGRKCTGDLNIGGKKAIKLIDAAGEKIGYGRVDGEAIGSELKGLLAVQAGRTMCQLVCIKSKTRPVGYDLTVDGPFGPKTEDMWSRWGDDRVYRKQLPNGTGRVGNPNYGGRAVLVAEEEVSGGYAACIKLSNYYGFKPRKFSISYIHRVDKDGNPLKWWDVTP